MNAEISIGESTPTNLRFDASRLFPEEKSSPAAKFCFDFP